MSTEQAGGAAPPTQADPSKSTQNAPQAKGAFLIPETAMTPSLRDAIHMQLQPKNADGTRKLDEQGKPALGKIVPAREDGHYRGRVLLEHSGFMVQAVGRNEEFAVVHRMRGLELQGPHLQDKARHGRMPGVNIEVHYKGEQGKVYPASEKSKEAPALTVDAVTKAVEQRVGGRVMEVAEKFAEKIKAASTREAFLNEIRAAVGMPAAEKQQEAAGPAKTAAAKSDLDASKSAKEASKTPSAPPPAKTASTDMER